MNLSDYDLSILIDKILDILMVRGIKATTMDDIAVKLSISKRTLYEIFKSKTGMVTEVMNRFHYKLLKKNIDYQKDSPSVMDSIMMSFIFYRDLLRRMNMDFLNDFDNLPQEDKRLCNAAERTYMSNFYSLLDRGAAEGYIRTDIDYHLNFRITQLQLTIIKRLSEVFPPDISLFQVYDTTVIGFLRGIASQKGIETIESRIHMFETATKHID
ncbi:MAG: TetR/AcrR family transcriptional regulator; helix-turn-helix transcriptional regulator [Muribaculaceae bacterium]|nr:TetR/AcrR family transcriptional regulator; helix-turn-helix transcriptional regulator [Muribaculaceae bacterium]